MGLPVAKSSFRSGKYQPTVQKPSPLKSFCNSGFRKIKVSFSRDEAPVPFHRNSNIYKDLLDEPKMLSRHMVVPIKVFLHLSLYL